MKVLVGLSGGVDSAVAAALLLEEGHDVVGATMKLWGGPADRGCCSVSDVDDARRSAQQLGIDHHVFNFSEDFDTHVVDPYVADHAAGLTPNPCIECNRHLKFARLSRRAEALGFDAVATGHHARRVRVDGRWALARGADRSKDQSYVLHPLLETGLDDVLLPIGDHTKDQVRARATDLGLVTASKPDSQDVCFITEDIGRSVFLGRRTALHTGSIVDTDGHALGEVEAVETVTIGQRRGLGLAGGSGPRYVVDVDNVSRRVTVGSAAELDRVVEPLDEMTWWDRPGDESVDVQTSAHGVAHPARLVTAESGRVELRWDAPRRRVAPGQSVVAYRGDVVIAGGRVASG